MDFAYEPAPTFNAKAIVHERVLVEIVLRCHRSILLIR
jgi:hypothetical protein